MKKVTFALLFAGAAMFASCGGDHAAADQITADSLARAKADSIAAVEAAAAAEAAAMDTTVAMDTTAAPAMAR